MAIAVLLIALLGFYGTIFFFADPGPGESWYVRLAIAFTFYVIASTIVAWLVYPKGYLALLLVWGCLVVAILNVQSVLSENTESRLNELALVAVPLAGTLVGTRLTTILKSRRAA